MCGIAGFMTTGAPANGELLQSMCDRLAHRGPDAYGRTLAGPLALGHRRLSIIDLATGEQPLSNEDGSVQVIFNGEIYNYRELRAASGCFWRAIISARSRCITPSRFPACAWPSHPS